MRLCEKKPEPTSTSMLRNLQQEVAELLRPTIGPRLTREPVGPVDRQATSSMAPVMVNSVPKHSSEDPVVTVEPLGIGGGIVPCASQNPSPSLVPPAQQQAPRQPAASSSTFFKNLSTEVRDSFSGFLTTPCDSRIACATADQEMQALIEDKSVTMILC